jgi:predicted SnoaL-like aldol condensation-catalyzing enzyme
MKILKELTLISAILVILCALAFSKENQGQSLHNQLESVYNNFKNSLQAEDENKIKATMSSKTYMKIKSMCDKKHKSFTTLMKHISKYYPDISDLKFLKVLNKGNNATLVYYSDSKEKLQKDFPMVDFTLIKFVKEHGYWKVNKIKIRTVQKFNKDGSLKGFDESML